ncbi:hypothetical protein DH2020_000792 [Rehmannia glutinosa]|uniref:DDHD domain-containing protein n=1 Tax=Rehmannia glutinosa TaxID=99300 RepID=A0ABR0XXZ3_REHGL
MDLNFRASGVGGVEETSPDMLKNTPSNIRRLASEIEQCEGRQKYLAHTRSPSDGGDVRCFCFHAWGILVSRFSCVLQVNSCLAQLPTLHTHCPLLMEFAERTQHVYRVSVEWLDLFARGLKWQGREWTSGSCISPRTEILGKGDYFRFGMRDSLAIEASFLQREDELLSSWWKEYAECSEGPRGTSIISKSTLQTKELFSESPESGKLYATEEERVGVPVKGGLYEVDLVRRHCFPVYWNGENRRVLRGHWFARKGGLDWLPLREDVSEQMEYAYRTQVWHRRTFQQSGLFAARVDLQGSTPGLHALFIGEDDTWEAWLNVDASGFSGVVGFGGNGIKLRRGYAPSQSQKPTQDELRQQKEEEMDDYCSQVKVLTLCESRCNDGLDEQSDNTQEKEERSYGSIMIDRLVGSEGGRIDHVLQDKTFRHPYVSAIGAHTNYWRDHDTALFMLKHLYRDIPEEPISPTEQLKAAQKMRIALRVGKNSNSEETQRFGQILLFVAKGICVCKADTTWAADFSR